MSLFLSLWFAMAASAQTDSLTRVQASSRQGNFTVVAEESAEADFAALEAERILRRFAQCLDIGPRRSSVPIVLVLGNENDKAGDDGDVRVFRKGDILKLQVNWDETPVSPDSFRRGWVRALCVRRAIENMPLSQRNRLISATEDAPDLRVPIWLTEGIDGLVGETTSLQEMLGRATLLARMEPGFSLDDAISEWDGKSQVDACGRSLAVVVCGKLLRENVTRQNFLRTFNWDISTTSRSWLRSLLGENDMDEWWRETWKNQASQFPLTRLGYKPSLRWVLLSESKTPSALAPSSPLLPEEIAFSTVSSVVHPWFHRWIAKRFSDSDERPTVRELTELRRDIQLRREASLNWFDDAAISGEPRSRSDLLLWKWLHRDLETAPRARGPVESWFDALAHRIDRKK
ncbi:MAG: hypothetical protein HY360_17750 [Verrucomicrobia bacterium]|nr:hypothetical protein [Verrucomicrobiota bacterium]